MRRIATEEKWSLEKAPAKLNLFLDVLSKRTDGYHNILSVMQSITLYDEIKVRRFDDEGYTFHCNGLVPSDCNLLNKTMQFFFNRCHPNPSFEVSLNKVIPICAGLGGGSTDAAATFRALNKLYGKPIRDEDYLELLDRLGSDVPFCMHGGTAICEGRGDIVTPINSPPLYYLLLNAGSVSKSAIAYSDLDVKYLDFKPERKDSGESHYKALLSYLFGYSSKVPELYNIFEDVVLEEGSNSMAHRILREYSASATLMTGSGPYVFGVYEDKALRDKAKLELEDQCVITKAVDSISVPVKDNSEKIWADLNGF